MKTVNKARNPFIKAGTVGGMMLLISCMSGIGLAQNKNICTIAADAQGLAASMTVTSPFTSMGIEQSFYFEIDDKGFPVKGKVTFVNGVERDLNTPQELNLIWAQFGGPWAVKDFKSKHKGE